MSETNIIPINGSPNVVRPPFPHLFDSTMIGVARSCKKKFEYSFLRNLAPTGDSVHLIAGAAFARGLEVARKQFYDLVQPRELAVACGLEALIREYGGYEPNDHQTNKSWERVAGALEYYFSIWPLGVDTLRPVFTPTGHKIEFTFCLPIPGTKHPTTGEEILYAGRCDMIGELDGQVYIVDEKTTGQLGAGWSTQWELRSQFTGYVWAAREEGHDVRGAIIRGIAIRKTGFDHASAIVYRPAWQVDRWLNQVRRDIVSLIECWSEGYYDYDLDSACSSYGGCQYLNLCKVPNPENWLSTYVERRWYPLGRNPAKDDENEVVVV